MEIYLGIAVTLFAVLVLTRIVRSQKPFTFNPNSIRIASRKSHVRRGGNFVSYRLNPADVEGSIDPFLLFLIHECWASQINLQGYYDDDAFVVDESFVEQFNIQSDRVLFDLSDYCDELCGLLVVDEITSEEEIPYVELDSEFIEDDLPLEEQNPEECQSIADRLDEDNANDVDPERVEHVYSPQLVEEVVESKPVYCAPTPVERYEAPEPEPDRSFSSGSSDYSSGGGSDYSSSGSSDCGGGSDD
jgi:hypothetical protein